MDNKNQVSATICSNCGTTTTPLWRRDNAGNTICNACGLYLKARNVLRPPTMKRNVKKSLELMATAANEPIGTCPGGGQCNGTGGSPSCEGCPAFNQHQVNRHALICANCRTTTTPLWRRDNSGNTICNACGLYYKLHQSHRPVSMKRSMIKRRKRIIVSDNGEEVEEEDDELDSSSLDEEEDDHEEKVKAKHKRVIRRPNSKSSTLTIVPPIEDYIIPKRMTLQEQARIKQEAEVAAETRSAARLPPPPRTPPFHPTKRFDPLFDYRTNSLPPPSVVNDKSPYQYLSEFDSAIARLERLRRRVSPEQNNVLARLTASLQEIVHEAEHIIKN